jgi:hypothetical protein
MSELEIKTRGDKLSFLPGEELAGQVSWLLDSPSRIKLRLFWRTEGKGTKDMKVVDRINFDNLKRQESREFKFQLPDGPYSFSGKLISLIWALELVVTSTDQTERLEIVISPTKSEILLYGGQQAFPPSGT